MNHSIIRSPITKPPMGVMPRSVHGHLVGMSRIEAINGAIERFIVANKEIPIEWIEERNELLREWFE